MNAFQLVTKRSFEFEADPRAVRGPGKSRKLVDIRIAIARELRGEPWGLSLSAIGFELGGRDHSTVLSLLRGGKRKPPRRTPCAGRDHMCKDCA